MCFLKPVTLTSPTDNIDNGVPSTTVCPYTRTSKLRYTVVTNQIEDFIVRCQASVQKNNGEMVTAVSEEFHLTSSKFFFHFSFTFSVDL